MARIFHRSAAIVMALAMVIGTMAFTAHDVSAQCANGGTCAPGSSVVWGSAINIQNRSTTAATVTIDFYRQDGTLATPYSLSEPLGPRASISIYVPALVEGLASGQYSAVVNSTEQVNVSVNTGSTSNANGPWAEFACEGMGSEQAGRTLYFPLLQNQFYNFDSEMVIQNTGTADATVSAKFFNQAGAQIATASLGTIKANAARTFTVGKFTTTPALPSGNNQETGGIFGAVVTSNQDVTGIVNIWRSTPRTGVASYSAFTEGSTTLYAPAILVDYYDFVSATTLQNVGTTTAQVTVDYVTSAGRLQRKFPLAPNAARALLEFNDTAFPAADNKLISAKITSTGGSLVGLISQSIPEQVRNSRATSPGGDFAAYALPSTPATSISIPSVTSDYYGLFVAVNVQNTSNAAADITITYADSPTCQGLTNKTRTRRVAAGASENFIHLGNNDLLPGNQRCATSAVVTSSAPLVATIQQNTERSVSGYNDAKKTGDFLSAITGIVAQWLEP